MDKIRQRDRTLSWGIAFILPILAGCSISPVDSENISGKSDPLFEFRIDRPDSVFQGHFVDVGIIQSSGSIPMGGFDLLIGYDASILAIVHAELGGFLLDCGWEYFTYRYNWNGDCGDNCPSGLVRLLGMADINNGAYHPDYDCISNIYETGEQIATMTFFVSNNLSIQCSLQPIRFYWEDCGDNSIATVNGDTLVINRYIYNVEGTPIQNYHYDFPSYYGAPDDPCMIGVRFVPVRAVDFINGGIDIICADSVKYYGDLNCNGVMNEIVDAIVFAEYFLHPDSILSEYPCAESASDVNRDGTTLSIADLVYLIKIIIGDAVPYSGLIHGTPITITSRTHNNELIIDYNADAELGAVLLVLECQGTIGEPIPGNETSAMDTRYHREGSEVRIIVYDIGSQSINPGSGTLVTIPFDGILTLQSADASDYDGGRMSVLINTGE